MKKVFYLAIVIFGTMILTGCGDTKNVYSCFVETDQGNITVKETIEAVLDSNDKVKTINLIIESNDTQYADEAYNVYKSYNDGLDEDNKIDLLREDNKITIKKAENFLEDESNKLIGISKEEFEEKAKSNSDKVICK